MIRLMNNKTASGKVISHFFTINGSHPKRTYAKWKKAAVEAYGKKEPEKVVRIIKPQQPSSTLPNNESSTTSRLDQALIKSELRPLSDLKYLYMSNQSIQDDFKQTQSLNEQIVKNVSGVKKRRREMNLALFILSSMALYLIVIVYPNTSDAGKNAVYEYVELCLATDDDYVTHPDLPKKDQYSKMRSTAFKRLYSFCENEYNWPLLQNCQIVASWSHILEKAANGQLLVETDTNLLYATRALERLIESEAFHQDFRNKLAPETLIHLLQRVQNNNPSRSDAFGRKQHLLLISHLTELTKLVYGITDSSFLKQHQTDYVDLIEDLIKSSSGSTELKRIGYHALSHIVSSQAITDYPKLKQFCDKLYEKYATDKLAFNAIGDPHVKVAISAIAKSYEEQFGNSVPKKEIGTYSINGIFSWKSIKESLFESNTSKLAQIYILGAGSYSLFRSYWRYWRFAGLNGRHKLFNYASPHAKKAILIMTPIFLYQTLASKTWEHQLFYKGSELGVGQQGVPLVAALKYAPIIGAIGAATMYYPITLFLIAPFLYGNLNGDIVLTNPLAGYATESTLSLDDLKRIHEDAKEE